MQGMVECDQQGCPAPGLEVVVLHGQDFYFCHHHARELELTAAVSVVRVTRGVLVGAK